MRYFLVVFLFLFVGCTKKDFTLKDLSLPQEASSYLASSQNGSNNIDPQTIRENLKKSYLKAWYSPWLDMKVKSNKKEVFWILKKMIKSTGYGEDSKTTTQKLLIMSLLKAWVFEHYPNPKIRAVGALPLIHIPEPP
ncbi:hypothetical protein JT096_07655, partial [Helicobacter pylori]|nr:hypothetical protein [Helicobacter pylori]